MTAISSRFRSVKKSCLFNGRRIANSAVRMGKSLRTQPIIFRHHEYQVYSLPCTNIYVRDCSSSDDSQLRQQSKARADVKRSVARSWTMLLLTSALALDCCRSWLSSLDEQSRT